jgi:hypothetical protein
MSDRIPLRKPGNGDVSANGDSSMSEGITTIPTGKGNGATILPVAAAEIEDLAKNLLLPNPDTLTVTAEMLVIPIVGKPGATEFFRTHPSLRLPLEMVTPNKGDIAAHSYAVMPAAKALLLHYKFETFVAVLYPIVIHSSPLTYKLVMVKPPVAGRKWDAWNLSRKLALDIGVTKWVAMRSFKGGYEACDPDPAVEFPEPEFPDYTVNHWLQKSFGVTDLIIRDDTHPVFREIKHL